MEFKINSYKKWICKNYTYLNFSLYCYFLEIKKIIKGGIVKKLYSNSNTNSKIQKEKNASFCYGNFIGILFSIFLLFGLNTYANNEVVNTKVAPAPITNFPAGVYIIDMGQPIQTVNNGLKPYGLVYALITAGIPVNWAIEPTKVKDGTDFIASSSGNLNKAYKGGSFIIDVVAYPAALAIINSWKTANVGLVVDGPTTAGFSAPIYKTLTIWPKAFLDAANDPLITPYYLKAGIPASTYVINANPTLLPKCGSSTGTQDLYILPHADPDLWSADWISSLQNFIDNGGSMWAGCHAVSVMESLPGCNFLSVNGLINYKTPGHTDGSPAYTYLPSANSDPVMQFIGIADVALEGGSEDIYVPGPAGWRNTTVLAAYDANYVNLLPNPDVAYTYPNAATVIAYGRAFGDATKGMIMYEAGHSFNGTDVQSVAAQRAFFNFLLLAGGQPQNMITPPNIANQTTTICTGVAFNVTPAGAAANVKYTWTAPTGTGFTGGSAQTVGQTSISQTLTNTTTNPVTAVYTVTPRIGGCPGNPFTLTVTVYPAPPTITLTSGAGTNIVTTPINVAMTPITYTTTAAIGATFSGLPPGVSGTWVAGVVTISGTPTNPVGVYNYTINVIGYSTCGSASATGTITTYVCPTFSLLTTTSSSVNVCLGSSSLVLLTANAVNLPVGTYLVSYEIQGVTQTPTVMIVTTAGIGSFVDTGFTTVGIRTITITNIASGLCSSVITTNNMDTVTVVAVLAAPTALAGSGATCTQITANWQASAGTTYYELDVSTSNTFASFVTGFNALNVGLVTSYDVTGLTTGTTYYYRIRAFNGVCLSGNSGTITYATTVLPGTVSSNAETLVNCNSFTANWNVTANATSYLLDVSTSNVFAAGSFVGVYNGFDVGNVLSFTVTGLNPNTQYYYRLKAKNGCGNSLAFSGIQNPKTTSAVPGTVTSNTETLVSCDRFTANWTAVAVATSYLLDVSTVNTFASFVGGYNAFDVGNVSSFTVTGLTPNTQYFYRLKAKNGCGISANYSGTQNPKTSNAVPGKVTSGNATLITCDGFTANWTALITAPAATSYLLDVSTSNTFVAGSFVGVYNGFDVGNVTSVTLTGLASGTTYYYRVRGVNSCGNATLYSDVKSAVIPSTLPGTVTSNNATLITCNGFTANWTDLAAATSYLLDVSTSNTFAAGFFVGGYNGFDVGDVTSMLITGLNPGTIYYYRVKAVNGCGISAAFSTTKNATIFSLPATPTISSSGPLTFCQNDNVTLGSSAGTTYLWSTGETTQFIFVTTAGNYSVQVTNANGCLSATSLTTTTVVQGLPTATAGGSQSICSNSTYTLVVNEATATNGTIAWTENGAGSITAGATTPTPTYTPAAGDAGNTVTLTMTVTSNNTCAPQIETATYTILVSGAPSPPTIGNITHPTGCNAPSGSVLLTNLPAGGTLNPGNVSYAGTSYTVTGLSPGTYTFTVTIGTCTSFASANVVINSPVIIDNIWNGTDWSLNHPPTDGTERIIFNTDFTSTVNLSGCSCQVNGGAIIIDSPNSLILTNEVNVIGGSLTFNNNASLIQINNVTNTGSINYIRTATNIKGSDYIYWSSPVNNQDISGIYTVPGQGPKYQWNTLVNNGNGAFGNISQGTWGGASGPMLAGKGYIIRGSYFGMPATNITSTFIGVPNNGNIPITVYRGDYTGANYVGANGATISRFSDNHNLLGNPYPSSINALQFLYDNLSVIAGSLNLWTHGQDPSINVANPFYGNYALNYSPSDYLPINYTGSTDPTGGEIIKAGQAFFVRMLDGVAGSGTVNFTNSLRRDGSGNPYSNSNFFRTSQVKRSASTIEPLERNRIWLDIIDPNNLSKRTLLGYVSGATLGVDHFYDAFTVPTGSVDLYSLIGNESYIIQGRPLPFDTNDIVPLGFKATTSGTFKIAIRAVDGLFENANQGIYLEDMELGIIHDLRVAPYLFNAVAGINNSRFVLRYTNVALGNENQNTNLTFAFISNNLLQIQSNENIKEIRIYDITGKLIKTYKPSELINQFTADFNFANGAYIAKIKLENGILVSKKLIH